MKIQEEDDKSILQMFHLMVDQFTIQEQPLLKQLLACMMGWCLYQESHYSVTLCLFNIDKFISKIVSVKGHELEVE